MESFKAEHYNPSSTPRMDLPPTVLVDDTDSGSAGEPDNQTRQLESRLLAPSAAMTSETQPVDITSTGVPHNPFNFQTQVISTSPVKSVSRASCAPILLGK